MGQTESGQGEGSTPNGEAVAQDTKPTDDSSNAATAKQDEAKAEAAVPTPPAVAPQAQQAQAQTAPADPTSASPAKDATTATAAGDSPSKWNASAPSFEPAAKATTTFNASAPV